MQDLSDGDAQACRQALAAEQAASLATTAGWSHVDREQVHSDWDVLYRTLAVAARDGALPSQPHIQDLIAEHYMIACRFYVPSREAYIGMSLFYGENLEMRTFHNGFGPDLVAFLSQAMQHYARHELRSVPRAKLTAGTDVALTAEGIRPRPEP
jgi:hypothetical protein